VLFFTATVATLECVDAGIGFGAIGECATFAFFDTGTATITGFFISGLTAIAGLACDFVAGATAFAGIGFTAGATFDDIMGLAAGIGLVLTIAGFAGSVFTEAVVFAAATVFTACAGFVAGAVFAGGVFAAGLVFGFAGVCAHSVPQARIATNVAIEVAINKRCFSFITILNYLATGLLAGAAPGSRLK
jgi:hypothetical protein